MQFSCVVLFSLVASQVWSESADSLPDEAMLEFLATFDEKDAVFIEDVMEEQQEKDNSMNGESHE